MICDTNAYTPTNVRIFYRNIRCVDVRSPANSVYEAFVAYVPDWLVSNFY